MGANFQTMKVEDPIAAPGTVTRNDVKRLFAAAQDQDLYENGHSYSGGFGMCSGLSFPSRTFDSLDAAENWLSEHAQKWDDALCVTVKPDADKPAFWLIGAWCAE